MRITGPHFAIPDRNHRTGEPPYVEVAVDLGGQAVLSALDAASIAPDEVDADPVADQWLRSRGTHPCRAGPPAAAPTRWRCQRRALDGVCGSARHARPARLPRPSSPTGSPSYRSTGPACRSFGETRQLADESTYRYLATAHASASTELHLAERSSGDSVGPETATAPGAPDPTTSEVRASARGEGITVPDRGWLRPDIWRAWRDAQQP